MWAKRMGSTLAIGNFIPFLTEYVFLPKCIIVTIHEKTDKYK